MTEATTDNKDKDNNKKEGENIITTTTDVPAVKSPSELKLLLLAGMFYIYITLSLCCNLIVSVFCCISYYKYPHKYTLLRLTECSQIHANTQMYTDKLKCTQI